MDWFLDASNFCLTEGCKPGLAEFIAAGNPTARPQDIQIAIVFAVVLALVRWFLENFVFLPMALRWQPGLEKPCKPSKGLSEKLQASLNLEWDRSGRAEDKQAFCSAVAKKLDGVSAAQAHDWANYRKAQAKRKLKLAKTQESMFRCFMYGGLWVAGMAILVQESWFFDTAAYWSQYPVRPLSQPLKYFYMCELGAYLMLFVSQFFDIKRKDFVVMFIHHVATVFLIV